MARGNSEAARVSRAFPEIHPTALAVHAARSATAPLCAAEALTRKVVRARFTWAATVGRLRRPSLKRQQSCIARSCAALGEQKGR